MPNPMFVLAHLAAGLLAARLWNLGFRRHPVNVWLVMLGGLLSDLIDKPLALAPWWQGGRSIGHTLLFLVALCLLSRTHRVFLPLAIGVATHHLLDDPRTYLETFAWPLLGSTFAPDEDVTLSEFLWQLHFPRATRGEILGAIVLVASFAPSAWRSLGRLRAKSKGAMAQIGRSVEAARMAAPTATETE